MSLYTHKIKCQFCKQELESGSTSLNYHIECLEQVSKLNTDQLQKILFNLGFKRTTDAFFSDEFITKHVLIEDDKIVKLFIQGQYIKGRKEKKEAIRKQNSLELNKIFSHLANYFYLFLNLRELKITNVDFESLPIKLLDLPNLHKLSLSNSSINSLPENFGTLQNLEELFFFDLKLENISSSIGSLTLLKRIYFHYLQIKNLPDSIGDLINLEFLTLDSCAIETIPETILNLRNLV